jgi:PBSX family phage portal protein
MRKAETPDPNETQAGMVGVAAMQKAPQIGDIVISRALEAEDEFRPYYDNDTLGVGMSLIEPPYNPATLQAICSENNTLGPCVDAMESNIDGTGYIVEKEGVALSESDPTATKLEEFFDEVFPGLSFVQLRRLVRRDLEQTGNGYIEVLRNIEGQMMFLRYVAARTIRVMRLDAPMVVTKKVMRFGELVEVPTLVRERRYAQMIGSVWIYFREFGATRHVNYETGIWEDNQNPLDYSKRGTEIIHLKLNPHYYTPYGLPRWEGAIPSVLGSRRAEEFNLEYFESGGLPPALITLSGGAMTQKARQSLEDQFNSTTKVKNRIAILETQATSGTLDKSGTVGINVHTFGQDREKDGLFQEYDKNCHDRTRRHFRLPPLFVGDIQAQNFSVAYTSYIVAENQVFRPERDIFDDMVNRVIMPALGGQGYIFRSKALSMADIQTKLAALQIAGATQHVDPKDIVEAVNEIADLDLAITAMPIQLPAAGPGGATPPQAPEVSDRSLEAGTTVPGFVKPKIAVHDGTEKPGGTDTGGGPSSFAKSDFDILSMADYAISSMRKGDIDSVTKVVRSLDQLPPAVRAKFNQALALRQYIDPDMDAAGLADIASCSLMGLMRRGVV